MRDDAHGILSALPWHGTLVRDGRVVGCWLAREMVFGGAARRPASASFATLMVAADGRVSGLAEAGLPLDVDPAAWLLARHAVRLRLHSDTAAGSFVGWLVQAATPQFADAVRMAALACLGQARGYRRGSPRDEEAALAVVRGQAATLAAFADTLDRGLVDECRSAAATGPRSLRTGGRRPGSSMAYGLDDRAFGSCWSGLDRTMDPDVPLRAALAVLPGLGQVVADAWVQAPGKVRAAVRDGRVREFAGKWVVERGILPARLAPALARIVDPAFGIGPDGVEGLPVFRPALGDPVEVTGHWDCWAADVVRRLRPLPPSWVPDGPAEWTAFALTCDVVDAFSDVCRDEPDWATLLNRGRGWTDLRGRLARATRADAGTPAPPLSHALADMEDMCNAFARQALLPAVVNAGRGESGLAGDAYEERSWRNAAFALLFSGRSLVRMLELSRNWHRREARMRADVATASGFGAHSLAWPAGLPDMRDGDTWIHVLTDDLRLGHEGAAGPSDGVDGLGHCVGGYGHGCLADGMRILSLRRVAPDGSWSRLSTAEVRWYGGRLHVDQHRGARNAMPPAAAEDALDRYADALASGALPVDEAGLEPLDGPVLMVDMCGFDHTDPVAREAVRRLWAPFLPGTVRTMPEGELARVALSLAHGGKTWCRQPLGMGRLDALPADPVPRGP